MVKEQERKVELVIGVPTIGLPAVILVRFTVNHYSSVSYIHCILMSRFKYVSLTYSPHTSLFASKHSTASCNFTLKTCSLPHIRTGHIEGGHSHPKLPYDLSLGKEGRHRLSRSNSQICHCSQSSHQPDRKEESAIVLACHTECCWEWFIFTEWYILGQCAVVSYMERTLSHRMKETEGIVAGNVTCKDPSLRYVC